MFIRLKEETQVQVNCNSRLILPIDQLQTVSILICSLPYLRAGSYSGWLRVGNRTGNRCVF